MNLSIIIPTLNRADLLDALLESFYTMQPVPFSWEVTVVDNGSKDHTREIVRKHADRFINNNLNYMFEKKAGLHNARHTGLKNAKGQLVAFLDDDMILEPSWIKGAQHLDKGTAQLVAGRILPEWETPQPEWINDFTVQCPYGSMNCYLGLLDFGNKTKQIDPFHVFGGNFFALKEIIIMAGGFNPDGMPPHLLKYRGDGETALMQKISSLGYTAVYEPDATAYHVIDRNRLTVEYFERRSFNQGISDSFTNLRKSNGEKPCINLNRTDNNKKDIRSRVQTAYKKGYEFHHRQVMEDPDLLLYVRRTSFL